MTTQRCRSGKHCASRTTTGPAATTTRPLCEGCITDIQGCVDRLPHYAALLTQFIGYKPAPVGQARVSGGNTEGETPLNITVVDLIDDIEGVLIRIDCPVRDLVAQPFGVAVALQARKLHMRAEGWCGLERVWQRRFAPCPECGLSTLGGWLGDDRIQCTNSGCATTLSKGQYEEHCLKESKA